MKRTYNDTMFIDTFEHEYTWLNGFMRNVSRFSSDRAILDPETKRSWTYKNLNEEANKLANALKKSGVSKNDIVMSAMRNSPEFVFSYIGPRKIGAILLAANFNLASGEMALLINHNKPKIILYTANIAEIIVDAMKICAWKPEKLIMADNIEGVPLPEGHIAYDDFIRNQSAENPVQKIRPHIYDEVLRLCTSGTTALPKSVPINDINEVLSAHDVIMHYPMSHSDVTLNMTPWFHRGGCHSGGVGPTFYAGASVIIMRRFMPHAALKYVSEYGITFMMGAPANLEMLARAQEKENYDISNLHGIVTMGAPLTKTDCIRFMKVLTPNIFNGYGTTETFWNSFLRPCDLPEGAGSVGRSCTDDDVRIIKIKEGKRYEPDELVPKDSTTQGEIIIRSPGKTTYSYFKDDKTEKAKFYKGWMYTGDAGTWNENGVVTVCGRKDDMIVVSGENIYPTQIEEAINEFSKVKDSIVTHVHDDIRGQAVVAYVEAQDKSLTIRELADFCSKSPMLSKYKRPRYFAIIDKLPRTVTGKKRHSEVLKRAEDDLKSGLLKKD